MKRIASFLLLFFVSASLWAQTVPPPDELYGELFTDVQLSRIFPDNKTFVDCTPKRDPAAILQDYRTIKSNPAIRFSLELFVKENFNLPPAPPQLNYIQQEKNVAAHITNLWSVLQRRQDSAVKGSSLLPLPQPYIVPGGRFREIYYWDSYFTMLGLKESGHTELIENMIRNFAFLIERYGHIPNGNRSYYLSRSQPPFFSLMVALLAGIKGDAVYGQFRTAMEKEWAYWMDRTAPTKHVVLMPDGSVLNRYYDQLNRPRQESYAEDVATKKEARGNAEIYRDLRSGAESGWDFSSRWFADGRHLASIQTTKLVPVDLNCLLYALEQNLAKAYRQQGNTQKAQTFTARAERRKRAINKYFWSAQQGWYTDYHLSRKRLSPERTLAGMLPFFTGVAPQGRAATAAQTIRTHFLKNGGVITTLKTTGQQWDAPNGWAPLEWMTIAGLEQYGQQALARTIAQRWMQLNVDVYGRTGKLMEKYNVVDTALEAGGGEYPSQDGFGWTNGVLLALMKRYGGSQTGAEQ